MEDKIFYIINKLLISAWDNNKLELPSILFKYYKKLEINEDDLAFICQIIYFDKYENNQFPTTVEIADRMTLSEIEIRKIIQKLISQGIIKITDKFDKQTVVRSEIYNLAPLYEKLAITWLEEEGWQENIDKLLVEVKKSSPNSDNVEPDYNFNSSNELVAYYEHRDIFTIFSNEFGRLLSPMETEKIASWINNDGHTNELIEEALKQAVYINKFNISYIDKILFEWKKQNIRTPQEAHAANERFQANKDKKKVQRKKQEVKSGEEASKLFYWEKK